MPNGSAQDEQQRRYDVALSFAGEDRPYVTEVAQALRLRGVRVFFDLFEEVDLWGKDLFIHLSDIYQRKAHFTLIFVSHAYVGKLWTHHERQAAQARAFEERREYILPARFDDSELAGLPATIGYVDLRRKSPNELAQLVVAKLRASGLSIEQRPHVVVTDHYDLSASDAHILLRLRSRERQDRIAIRVDTYASVGKLLDDLFMHYLSDALEPFTYGSAWVLSSGFVNWQLLLPWQWVRTPGEPSHRIAPEWQSKSLADVGIVAGGEWEATRLSDAEESVRARYDGAFVLACNDPSLGSVVRNNPKAYGWLYQHDKSLSRVDIEAFRPNDFKYAYVFRDWLRLGLRSAVLVESGDSLCARVAEVFQPH